ncbi:MAG: MarR family transcriptional regulator [Microbacterium enclense]
MNTSKSVKYRHGASFLLATLGRRAEKAWHAYLAERGVTTAQFTAMAALVEGERTQGEVAVAAAVDPRNISATVKDLVAEGWVQVRQNPDDARSRLLSLTPAGREWWAALQPSLRRGRDSFFQALTPDELATLEHLLGRLESFHAGD